MSINDETIQDENPVALTADESVDNAVESTENESTEPSDKPAENAETEEKKVEQDPENNSVIRQMRKQIKALQKQLNARSQPVEQPAPTRADFATEEEYIDARVAHQVNKAVQPQQPVQDPFAAKFAEARKAHTDFDEALEDISHVMFSSDAQTALRQAVETLPYGSDILYHIAKNPDLAEELSILPAAAFAARLGDIHGDIRRTKTATKKPSAAPAPVKPVKPSGSSDVNYDDMSYEDFVAQRAKERRQHKLRYVK
jgi:hypothetical protein